MTGRQQEYMTATRAYPIARSEGEIVPLLRDEFCRAVILRDPVLAFDASGVSAEADGELAARYWRKDGNLASGRIAYEQDFGADTVAEEARNAKITLSSVALSAFTAHCRAMRGLFSRVFSAYAGLEGTPLRAWPLFTAAGGQGRSPHLHADNTLLTLHASAALSTLRVCDTELPEDVWQALDRATQDRMSAAEKERNRENLVVLAYSLPMLENRIGDVTFAKGQLRRSLLEPRDRNGVCVHVSSPTITAHGQAALLMTPRMT